MYRRWARRSAWLASTRPLSAPASQRRATSGPSTMTRAPALTLCTTTRYTLVRRVLRCLRREELPPRREKEASLPAQLNPTALARPPSGYWQTAGTFGFLVLDKARASFPPSLCSLSYSLSFLLRCLPSSAQQASHAVPLSRPLQALTMFQLFCREVALPASAFSGPGARHMFVEPISGSASSTMVQSPIASNVAYVLEHGPYRRRDRGVR